MTSLPFCRIHFLKVPLPSNWGPNLQYTDIWRTFKIQPVAQSSLNKSLLTREAEEKFSPGSTGTITIHTSFQSGVDIS